MSQRQLADPRYDGSFVSQIEAGRRMPSPEALSFFARKLRVSPDDLAAEVPPSTRLELEMARQEAQTAFDAGNVGAAKEAFDHLLELARGAGSADTIFHFRPAGNPAPPRPRRPESSMSAMTSAALRAPLTHASARRYPPAAR